MFVGQLLTLGRALYPRALTEVCSECSSRHIFTRTSFNAWNFETVRMVYRVICSCGPVDLIGLIKFKSCAISNVAFRRAQALCCAYDISMYLE
jgi:precorrin isomerase